MKKFVGFFLFSFLFGLLSICSHTALAAEVPYKTGLSHNSDGDRTITITATVDSLTIQKVTANRGNCGLHLKGRMTQYAFSERGLTMIRQSRAAFEKEMLEFAEANKALPVTLKYGQSLTILLPKNCNLLEVEWQTDKGVWKDNYNK